MEKYEQIAVVGEGSYGSVMKCRHRDSGQIVAIKKFLDTEEELTARRMALREIRMLKKLRHENLVCLIEVFRVRKRFHLVFEFVDRTVLDELEECDNNGLSEQECRERILQVIRAVRYCHLKHIIHRDVKPENVLVSRQGVVKLCDFGFARLLSNTGEPCTEYVATRWYRAPELLVADVHYGPAVDVWAIGCLFSEMMTGRPLFPGDSDIDQLYRICNILGQPCYRHLQLLHKNPSFKGVPKCSNEETTRTLSKLFPNWSNCAIDFLVISMRMDPSARATTEELLRHNYLNHDKFVDKFLPKLRQKVLQEYQENPLIRKYQADIIAASDDRRQDIYTDRYGPKKLETPRWKINLQDPYTKRKTSYMSFSSFRPSDNFSAAGGDGNLMSKVSFLQPPPDKSKLNLQRSEARKQPKKESTKENHSDRPLSDKNIDLHLNSESPLMFASLQSDNTVGGTRLAGGNTSPEHLRNNLTNVLHPTINNLSFNKSDGPLPPKRLTTLQAQLLQANQRIKDFSKSTSNQTTSFIKDSTGASFNQQLPTSSLRDHYLRKLGRGLVLDVTQLNNSSSNDSFILNSNNNKTPPYWLNTAGYTMYKKNNQVEQTTWTKLDTCAGAAAAANTNNPTAGTTITSLAPTDRTSFPNINNGSPYRKKKLPQFLQHDTTISNTNITPKRFQIGQKRKLLMNAARKSSISLPPVILK